MRINLEGVSRGEKAVTLGTGTSTVRIVDDAMFKEVGEICETLCATCGRPVEDRSINEIGHL